MNQDLSNALKGFGMGAANVIPGVSGGTIALLTGIFGRLVEALNAIMLPANWKLLASKGGIKDFWKAIDGRFLAAVAVGAVLSVFTVAKLMEYVLTHHPVQTWAFFFGLIIASSAYMIKDIKGWKPKDIALLAAGAAAGALICTLSPAETPDGLWFIFICGAVAICTMILPGISGSFILLILGKYEYIMSAVNSLDVPVLAVFAIGCAAGLLAFSRLLHFLLGKWERETMVLLIGFVLGSLIKVWPWYDMQALAAADGSTGNLHICGAVTWAAAGVIFTILLQIAGNRASSADNKD